MDANIPMPTVFNSASTQPKLNIIYEKLKIKQCICISIWFKGKKYGWNIIAYTDGMNAYPKTGFRGFDMPWKNFNCLSMENQMAMIWWTVKEICIRFSTFFFFL